ncbi:MULTISPECIES: hypothetical protein [Robertmurraya]|uniref:Uncharacterized protein n=1 Tax=Robertmurraya beringensis TaxID=641660 RepID=A0ABV6KLH4_9BACI
MKKKINRILSISAFCFVLLLPSLAMASSYVSTFSILTSSGFKGATRSYDGSNLGITTYGKTADGQSAYGTSSIFYIALYRDNTWADDHIGTVTHSRTADSTSKWSSVGKGNYYFTFWKNDDKVYVKGTVGMFNY